MPKVTVVIPVYNVEQYLHECLNSVVSQTLKDIEIICVNDGSTDGSSAILLDYSLKDKRIKIINQENRGLSGARNSGAQLMSGDYIYFLDSDDFIDKNALECLYKRAIKDNLDILYFDAVPFFEDNNIEVKHSQYKTYYERNRNYFGVKTGPKLLSEMSLNLDWKPSAWLQFISSEFYKSSALSFFEGIFYEDNLFSLEAVLKAKRVGYEDKIFIHRRIRSNSIVTMEKRAAHFNGYFVCYIEMIRFCQNIKISDPNIIKAVSKLIIGVLNNSIALYCSISIEERSSLKPYDLSPDVVAEFEFLTRQAKHNMKLPILRKKRLNSIRNYFRLMRIKRALIH